MRAWTVDGFGHFRERLILKDVDDPVAEADASVIEVKAAGVMFADLLNIAGEYQMKAPLPFVPGSEASGVVVEAGPESRFKPGDRVVSVNLMGAFAERMLAVDQTTMPIPEGMNDVDAAALTINFQTAYFALVYRANVQPGETVLIHGGAGGVGTAAIQVAKHLGATVIATAATDDKLEVCRQCGADYTINYGTHDFVRAAKEMTEGVGADVILDPVGGDVFDKSTKCIAFEGRLLVIGFAGGRIPEIAANRILLKNISVVGLFWGSYQVRNPELVQETQDILYRLYAQGAIKPVIYQTFPLDALPQALEAIESRRCYGKPVMVTA